MSTIAFAPRHNGEWFDIQFRYDPDLVELIKTVIPPSFRKWDTTNKTWSASKMWAQAFAAAAQRDGHTISGVNNTTANPNGPGFFNVGSAPPPPKPPPPPPRPQITENWARELMRRTPSELREKLYKNLAKVLHEDLGGDGRLMQELNDSRAFYVDRGGKTA